MLKFGNKEFRNLQEQVLKNMQDIDSMKEGTAVLDEFGIKVVGEVDSLADLPTVAEYKEAHEDWAYGDAYAVGTEAPYTLYILTRGNETITADHWFDIGEFPAPGPQGETGPEGPIGPQGQTGNPGTDGASAGFGTITATAQTLVPGSSATATVVASGPDTAKSFAFTFGIPRGQKGEPGGVTDVEVNDNSIVDDGVAKIDLDQYSIAFLNRNQAFSGNNTFNGDATFTTGVIIDRPGTMGNSKWRIVEAQTGEIAFDRYYNNTWETNFIFTPSFFTSYTSASLGSNTTPFNDIYFDGIISDCKNVDYGLVLPDTTNFSDNKTIATTDDIPTATSALTNDSGFITGITSSMITTALGYTPGTSNFSGAYADLTGKPTIPTATSDLTNDSGFITSSALSSYATITYVDTGLSSKSSATNLENDTGTNSLKQKGNTASGNYSFANGFGTTASGIGSHAEGNTTTASSSYSHAEGNGTSAGGYYSHSEGVYATASGLGSHAEGRETVAGYSYQHVSGKYNDNKSTTLFEVGNGTADNARSNAFEVYADGHATVGGNTVATTNQITPEWYGTQAQYDALATKDPDTLYFIEE